MSRERRWGRRQFVRRGAVALGAGVASAYWGAWRSPARRAVAQQNGLDRITFGTNWYAQAEHGGFYQAVATGIYADYGLDVTIQMGGPQVNGTQLLMGRAVDFFMGYSSSAIKAVEEDIPVMAVAALFQKDPQILIAHPNTGVESPADLVGRPIYISAAANTTFWPFLVAKFGLSDAQKRPYNFNPGPFLADKQAVQQGYLTSEPLAIQTEGGFDPVVMLLADFGYSPYATTIETRTDIVDSNPDLVERFVDASVKGWYSYFDDPAPANQLIQQDNPEMTDEQLAYSVEKLQQYGILNSGEATSLGMGAMTDDRWMSFYDAMVEAGIFDAKTDVKQAYSLDFVNKGVEYYTS